MYHDHLPLYLPGLHFYFSLHQQTLEGLLEEAHIAKWVVTMFNTSPWWLCSGIAMYAWITTNKMSLSEMLTVISSHTPVEELNLKSSLPQYFQCTSCRVGRQLNEAIMQFTWQNYSTRLFWVFNFNFRLCRGLMKTFKIPLWEMNATCKSIARVGSTLS